LPALVSVAKASVQAGDHGTLARRVASLEEHQIADGAAGEFGEPLAAEAGVASRRAEPSDAFGSFAISAYGRHRFGIIESAACC